jgi:hypothetical protein
MCRNFTFHLDPASEVVAAKSEPISTDVKLTFFAMWQPQRVQQREGSSSSCGNFSRCDEIREHQAQAIVAKPPQLFLTWRIQVPSGAKSHTRHPARNRTTVNHLPLLATMSMLRSQRAQEMERRRTKSLDTLESDRKMKAQRCMPLLGMYRRNKKLRMVGRKSLG